MFGKKCICLDAKIDCSLTAGHGLLLGHRQWLGTRPDVRLSDQEALSGEKRTWQHGVLLPASLHCGAEIVADRGVTTETSWRRCLEGHVIQHGRNSFRWKAPETQPTDFLPTADTYAVVRTVVFANDNAFLWCIAHDRSPLADLRGGAVTSVNWGRFVLGESRRKLWLDFYIFFLF